MQSGTLGLLLSTLAPPGLPWEALGVTQAVSQDDWGEGEGEREQHKR